MSISKKDFLGKFILNQEKVHLESIDADVVIRNFTADENDKFTQSMVTGIDKKGEPIVDLKKSMSVKYRKISAALVEPKISVDELRSMYDAKPFIEEMIKLIDKKDPEKFDEEGNENSDTKS